MSPKRHTIVDPEAYLPGKLSDFALPYGVTRG
jgi:hypothetical protein